MRICADSDELHQITIRDISLEEGIIVLTDSTARLGIRIPYFADPDPAVFSQGGSGSEAGLTKFVKINYLKVLKKTKKIAQKLKTLELVHIYFFFKIKEQLLLISLHFSVFSLEIYPPGSGSKPCSTVLPVPVDHDVWIAPDGRGEVGVEGNVQGKVMILGLVEHS